MVDPPVPAFVIEPAPDGATLFPTVMLPVDDLPAVTVTDVPPSIATVAPAVPAFSTTVTAPVGLFAILEPPITTPAELLSVMLTLLPPLVVAVPVEPLRVIFKLVVDAAFIESFAVPPVVTVKDCKPAIDETSKSLAPPALPDVLNVIF